MPPGRRSYTITAVYSGGGSYGPSSGTTSFAVTPAVLTVTANNASSVYGAALPAFTAVYSGFVNGDTSAVLRGAPSLTTTATPASPAGTYPITAASGTLSAANYTFSFVNGTLTVDQITLVPGISFTLTSSLNPSTYGQSVTFTATIPPAATGTMQFLDNGVAMGSPVAVVSGVATYTTSAITVGTQAITAYYSGDSNYSPATSLPVNQVVNSTATVTQISSSLNPSTYGSPVTFSSSVNSNGTNPAPTGTVTFFDGTTNIGSSPVATTASTTNLLPYSQNTTQATWGPYCGSSANQSPATAPDGFLTATQIVLPSSFTCGSGNSWGTIDRSSADCRQEPSTPSARGFAEGLGERSYRLVLKMGRG